MTDISKLVEEAKKRLDSMTGEEIRAKFIEHGYVPSEADKELLSTESEIKTKE